MSLLVAIAPIVPVLVTLGVVVGTGGVVYAITRARRKKLAEPKRPRPLKPGEEPGPEPEPNGAPGAGEVVAQYSSTEYDDNSFQVVKDGDSISGTATRILNRISPGMGSKPAMVRAIKQLLNSSAWNAGLYDEPSGDMDAIDGRAINGAYSPKHENAIGTMSAGYLPARNTDTSGKRTGTATNWGSPWIPALNHDAVRGGVTDPELLLAPDWADGSPATDPPPEVFDVLAERGG